MFIIKKITILDYILIFIDYEKLFNKTTINIFIPLNKIKIIQNINTKAKNLSNI